MFVFTFTCTLCHKVVAQDENTVALYVRDTDNPDRDWHYVPNFFAAICSSCQETLRRDVYTVAASIVVRHCSTIVRVKTSN